MTSRKRGGPATTSTGPATHTDTTHTMTSRQGRRDSTASNDQLAPVTVLVPAGELVAWRLALELLRSRGTPGIAPAHVVAALRRRGWPA